MEMCVCVCVIANKKTSTRIIITKYFFRKKNGEQLKYTCVCLTCVRVKIQTSKK